MLLGIESALFAAPLLPQPCNRSGATLVIAKRGYCWLRTTFGAPGTVFPAKRLFWNVATIVPGAMLIPVPLLKRSVLDSRMTAVPLNPTMPVPLLLTTVDSTFMTEAMFRHYAYA